MNITRFSNGIYLEVFNQKYSKYGGHWQKLGNVVNFIVYYLSIRSMCVEDFGFGIFPKSNMFGYSCMYYDGYNHSLWFWKFHFGWGGGPFLFGGVDLMHEFNKSKGIK